MSSSLKGITNMSEKLRKFLKLNKEHKPLIISGPSGVGKGSVFKQLYKADPNLFELSVSYTTRKKRYNEQNGKDYFFVTASEFQQEINKGVFAEYHEVHGNLYGTHMELMKKIIDSHKICVLDIDRQGGKAFQSQFPDWNYTFLNTSTYQLIEERLRKRGTECEEQMQIRIKNAIQELKDLKSLSYYIEFINDDLDQCVKDYTQFIKKKYSNINLQQ